MNPTKQEIYSEPTLLIHKERAVKNIQKMLTKARNSKVLFRPHFKTHQSVEVGNWFRNLGVSSIAVSSVSMAEKFAQAGWEDIQIAFPANLREIDSIQNLARRIHLELIFDHLDSIQYWFDSLGSPTGSKSIGSWIEVDTGLNRSGIPDGKIDEILKLAGKIIESKTALSFRGLLAHAGHSYSARSNETIREIYQGNSKRLQFLKEYLEKKYSIPVLLSFGDTPCCSIVDSFEIFDEIRPGNFVYYDLMQVEISSCTEEEIAMAVACPVVSKRKDKLVLYGGAVHLSLASIQNKKKQNFYGRLALLDSEQGWSKSLPELEISKLNQEHAVIYSKNPELLDPFEVGKIAVVLPIHSCLVADLYQNKKSYIF